MKRRQTRRRAAAWCLDNGMPEAALEYFMAAERWADAAFMSSG
jgi:hypothetical protein